MRSCFFIVSAIALLGCSTNQLIVDSSPQGAEVYLVAEKPVNLGKTPLTITNDEFEKNVTTPSAQLEIRKENFEPAHVLLSDFNSTELKFHVNLKKSGGFSTEKKNQLVESLFQVQRFIRLGMLDKAQAQIATLKKDSPDVAAVHELEGSIYILQKNWIAAYDAFERALAFNPQGDHPRKVMTQLAAKVNQKVDRLPASQEVTNEPPGQSQTNQGEKDSTSAEENEDEQ